MASQLPTEEEVLGSVSSGKTYDDSLPPFNDPLEDVPASAAKEDIVVEIVDDAPAVVEKPAVAAKPPIEDDLAPLPDDPPGVQKRINKLTAKNHAERRERLRVEHERDSLVQHTAQLRQRLEMAERAAIGQQGYAVQSQKTAIEAQLAQTRELIRQAVDSGDAAKMISGQEILASLVSRKNDIDKYTQPVYNGPSVPEYVPATAKPQGEEERPCTEFVLWHEANPWFGVDKDRSAYAEELDTKLKAIGELDPTSPKFFEAIDRGIRARFPVTPDGDNSTSGEKPSAQSATPVRRGPVAPATRTSATQPRSVKLTPDEAAAADKMRPANIPREQWLKTYAHYKTSANPDGSYTYDT